MKKPCQTFCPGSPILPPLSCSHFPEKQRPESFTALLHQKHQRLSPRPATYKHLLLGPSPRWRCTPKTHLDPGHSTLSQICLYSLAGRCFWICQSFSFLALKQSIHFSLHLNSILIIKLENLKARISVKIRGSKYVHMNKQATRKCSQSLSSQSNPQGKDKWLTSVKNLKLWLKRTILNIQIMESLAQDAPGFGSICNFAFCHKI